MLIEIDKEGVAHCRCKCGALFDYGQIDVDSSLGGIYRSIADSAVCDKCIMEQRQQEQEKKLAEQRQRLAATIDDRMAAAGFPPRFAQMQAPFVRHAAEWLWHNQRRSLVMAGVTGTGKTSSAAFVARLILRERFERVRYCSRQGLIADYVRAKTSDDDSEAAFYRRIAALDILIIDEMVGKKGSGKLSDSSQELFFSLIDGVYSMERSTRVWLLGNFYAGAIDDMFDDPAPVKRRLADSFALGWVSETGVENIALA